MENLIADVEMDVQELAEMLPEWQAGIDRILAHAEPWIKLSQVAAWAGFGFAVAALIVLILKLRKENV